MDRLIVVLWYAMLGFDLLMYILLDGYDLGVGILSLFSKDEKERSRHMNAISAVWDANETWLVLFGGMLFGAFPAGYGLLLSALYVPILVFLSGLIFRAVSFGFRSHSKNLKAWGVAFGAGSLTAAIGQGFFLGGILNGIRVENLRFAGGPWDWFSPFTVTLCAGLVSGYLLLGSTYLARKTSGKLRERNFRAGFFAASAVGVFGSASILWSVFRVDYLAERFTSRPWFWLTSIPLFLGTACLAAVFYGLYRKKENVPFVSSVLLFLCAFVALVFSMYPWLVPGVVTAFDAAAVPGTLYAMLIGAGLLLPIIIGYNLYEHHVFRGKTGDETSFYG